jgi:hypothetical protein
MHDAHLADRFQEPLITLTAEGKCVDQAEVELQQKLLSFLS